ncbi:putative secreted protein [Brevundimonas alba]|uniref:Putative secreted protein n=1 Tax=Brevundimonas alba TaxID=74314 RepID=A0A7X5YM19_9CAUL|nr:hypothetical protein [Brevundimonas alba]NJC42435.1 putative secreted protein [Brevundimonas alba]
MPTFIFETDAGTKGPRSASVVLPDLRAAQIAAVKYLGELLSDDGDEFWKEEMVTMTVSDNRGLCLFRLDLSAVRSSSFPKSAVATRAGV